MKTAKKPSPELMRCVDRVGGFIEYWGFKEIEGRIWAYTFLSKKGVCAEEIIRDLEVSKALVSMSVTRLLDYDVLVKSETGPRGIQYYRANPKVSVVIRGVLRRRERPMLSEISSSVKDLVKAASSDNGEYELDKKRLSFMKLMVSSAEKLLDVFVLNRKLTGKLLDFGVAPSESGK